MSSVSLVRLAFSYVSDIPILDGIDHRFEPGFTALVGANGAGKSTLLSLIRGALIPDHGEVRVEPRGSLVVGCPQIVDEVDDEIVAFASAYDGASARLRAELELDHAQMERWSTLSPGERKRFQIGAALAQRPDVLLLDEPTNHLDVHARVLLEKALRRFGGVGIVVSHDRGFIEEMARFTVWLERGRLRAFEGGYAAAEEVREMERGAQEEARHRARAQAQRSARTLDARRRQRASAERSIGARRRMKSKHDSDGRSVNRKARAAKAEAAHARAVKSIASRHAREAARARAIVIDKRMGGELFVGYAPSRSKRLAALSLPVLTVAGRVLLKGPLSLVVERESRIRVCGDNGVGKSTLLGVLLGALPEDTLHVPQEMDERARRASVDRVLALPKDARGRVLSLVALLGSEPARVLSTGDPSPGEAKKLAIAEGLGRGATCVVLDEPTNHLDLPSIERLEAALALYPGALLLVTHDAWFGQRLTREEWHIEDLRLTSRA